MRDVENFVGLGEVCKNQRGFEFISFNDSYGCECILQESSAAAPHIWLGFKKGGSLHLSRNQVEALVAHLKNWLDTGSFDLLINNVDVLYSVDGYDARFCFRVSSAFIYREDNYYIAQLAAEDFFTHRDGHKADWPIIVTLQEIDGLDDYQPETFRVHINDYKSKAEIMNIERVL